MESPPLVVLGSSRRMGDTQAFVENVLAGTDYHLADLLDFSVAPYNYEHTYPAEDTFSALSKQVLAHQTLVLATPVYWYSMSGLMKNFFDRLTDLTTFQKHLGRQLKGKNIFLLAVGTDAALPHGFLVPFESSCHYLDMEFKGFLYRSTQNALPASVERQQIKEFRTLIFHSQGAKRA